MVRETQHAIQNASQNVLQRERQADAWTLEYDALTQDVAALHDSLAALQESLTLLADDLRHVQRLALLTHVKRSPRRRPLRPRQTPRQTAGQTPRSQSA